MNSSLLLLATICFVAMISPGPDFILVTKNSFIHSRRHALATAFGIVTGCLFHATYCTLGLALIITQSALIFSMIKYAGAGYLIFLGLKGLLSRKVPEKINVVDVKQSSSIKRVYFDGVLCNVLNPKLAVFLLSLFTQFISVGASLADKSLVAGIFVIESAIYWPLLVLVLQSFRFRKLFDNFRTILDRIFGSLLICLGLRVALL